MRLTLTKSCPLKSGKSPDKAGGKWHCGTCNESVHDISGMTADDAARFLQLRGSDEQVCGEWAEDADGNVLFNLGRAAAAAAAIFVAGPAMADGLESLPDTALIALFGEDGATNVQHDLQSHSTEDVTETATQPIARPMYQMRGAVRPTTRTPPVTPTPTSKP